MPKNCQVGSISETTGGNIVPATTATIEELLAKFFGRIVFKFVATFATKKARQPDITKAIPRPINLDPFSTKRISKIKTKRNKDMAPINK